MYQHPTEQQLTEYKRRTLAPDAFRVIHGHISECVRCSARCYEQTQTRTDYETLLAALTPAADELPYHLTDETAIDYIADKLNEIDREPAVTHLEVCAECSAMIARIRAAREEPVLASTNPAIASATTVARLPAQTWFKLWPARLSQLRHLQLAAAVLLFVVLLGAALLLFRAGDTQPAKLVRQDTPPENDNAQPTPATSPQPEPTPAQPAQIVLDLKDAGRQVTLDAKGNLAGLEHLPEQLRQQIKSVLIKQQIPRAAILDDLNRRPGTLLGEGDRNGLPFRLLAPLGVVIESDQPTFRWQPLAGADSYNVTVTDDKLNEVATSGPVMATSWRVPHSLARGGTYSWQVTAHKKDGQTVTSPVLPAPQAKFQVLARTRLKELRQARRVYPDSYLTLGILYAQAGMLNDAAREFQALVQANPQADVVHKLLRDVRALNARRRSG